MIYKFKSPAAGDVIMLGPQGDRFLSLLGREPAASGIIEPEALAAALAALQAALAQEQPEPVPAPAAVEPTDRAEPAVALRQRLWPMVELLRRAQAAGQAVVWGV
jgi:hypothetical protein